MDTMVGNVACCILDGCIQWHPWDGEKMKFNKDVYKNHAVINGVKIYIPYGIRYITINMNGVVQAWADRPFISEGYWDCLVGPGYRLGTVDWEDGDQGHYHIHEVVES